LFPSADFNLDRGRQPWWDFDCFERLERRDGPLKQRQLLPAADTFLEMNLDSASLCRLDLSLEIRRKPVLNLIATHYASK
jgi:hypothetical protein